MISRESPGDCGMEPGQDIAIITLSEIDVINRFSSGPDSPPRSWAITAKCRLEKEDSVHVIGLRYFREMMVLLDSDAGLGALSHSECDGEHSIFLELSVPAPLSDDLIGHFERANAGDQIILTVYLNSYRHSAERMAWDDDEADFGVEYDGAISAKFDSLTLKHRIL